MRNLFKIAILLVFSSQVCHAQDKAWQMELRFKGGISPERFENEIPEFAKEFYEPFLAGKTAYKNIEIVTDGEQSAAIVDERDYTIWNKKLKKTYSYSKGDDVVTSEIYRPFYPVFVGTQSTAGQSYVLLHDLNEIEDIAGITCKKVKLLIKNNNDSAEAYVWYSEGVPTYYLSAFPFMNNLPGAVLKLVLTNDTAIGFEISKISSVGKDAMLRLPERVKVVDISEEGSAPTEESATGLFEDTFPLNPNLKWAVVRDNETGDDYYGIQDESGKEVQPCSFYSLEFFNEHTAIVSDKENYFWLLNKAGEKVNKKGVEWLTPANDQLAIFQLEGNYGLIASDGKILLENKENISPFLEGYLIFTEKGKLGVLDARGKIVVEPALSFLDVDGNGNVLLRKKDQDDTQTMTFADFKKEYLK